MSYEFQYKFLDMYILGVVEGHNSSAALLHDGDLVAVCFEERLTRLKNEFGYPIRSIEWCMKYAGITPEEIDSVAMVTENLPFAQIAVKREATFDVADYIREQEEFWKPYLIEKKKVNYLDIFKDKIRLHELPYCTNDMKLDRTSFEEFREIRKEIFRTHLKKRDDQLHIVNHHLAHSFYAIFSKPTSDRPLLVLASDGYGDDCSASVGIWRKNKFEFISKSVGSGIGRIYRYATLLLGMRPGVDEYKMMGLAPYAKEYRWRKVCDAMRPYLKVIGMKIDYTNPDPEIYFSLKERLKAFRFDEIAAGVQNWSEDISVEWVRNCISATEIRDIVYSGGVSMNVKINKRIMEMPEVNSIFIGPSGGDESLSIGAAWALWHQMKPSIPIKPLSNTYLGPAYSKEECVRAIREELDESYIVKENASDDDVVDLLEKGFVVARAVGRMEYGARALGNRSILARPDDPMMIRRINNQVKNRDFWMPFAPVILQEYSELYLVNPKSLPSPYMTLAFDSKPLARKHLRAALHPADDTMRAQILTRDDNPKLHALVTRFAERTSIGGLLNTSFNLHGEPICCSPQDSLRTLKNSGLDAVLLENFLIRRKK